MMSRRFAEIQALSEKHLMRTYNRLPVAFVDGRRRSAARHRGQRIFGFSRRHRRVGAGPQASLAGAGHPGRGRRCAAHFQFVSHRGAGSAGGSAGGFVRPGPGVFLQQRRGGQRDRHQAGRPPRSARRRRTLQDRVGFEFVSRPHHGRDDGHRPAQVPGRLRPVARRLRIRPAERRGSSGGGGGRADRGGDFGTDPRRIGRPPVHVRLFAGSAAHLRRNRAPCSFWTRCKRASDAPAACSPSSTTACGPTS